MRRLSNTVSFVVPRVHLGRHCRAWPSRAEVADMSPATQQAPGLIMCLMMPFFRLHAQPLFHALFSVLLWVSCVDSVACGRAAGHVKRRQGHEIMAWKGRGSRKEAVVADAEAMIERRFCHKTNSKGLDYTPMP